MVGSYLEMASAIGWGLKVASLAGKTLWLGRHRDAIRPGLWSPVPPASPPFYLFQLNSGCEFRHVTASMPLLGSDTTNILML